MTEAQLDFECGDQRGLLRHVRRSRFSCSTLAQVIPVVLVLALVTIGIAAGDVGAGAGAELDINTGDFQANNTTKELYLRARADVLDIMTDGDSIDHCSDNWRRWKYQQCTQPSTCGKALQICDGVSSYARSVNGCTQLVPHPVDLGWLFRQQGLILVIPGVDDGSLATDWKAGESRTVIILGLKEEGSQAECDAFNLSMLVRLQGPEALAKAASAVKGKCEWAVELKPTLPGTYTLDVTLIEWKGFLEPHRQKCNTVRGAYGEGSVKMGGVPQGGGPFYGAPEGCCTLCTRLQGCVAWSATDRPDLFLVDGDRCVIYSSVVGRPVETKEQQGEAWSGNPRGEEAMTYLGPSMSMTRSWCSQRNGVVFGSGLELTVMPATHDDHDQDLPLCREHLRHEGRWVRLDLARCSTQRWKSTSDGWPNYDITRFGTQVPEECFLARGKIIMPGTSPNTLDDPDARPDGFVFSPYDCRYDVMNTHDRMQCLRDKNVTRFLDFGDSLIETSRVPRTALFLPKKPSHWSNGFGKLQAAPGAEQQGCKGQYAKYYGHDDRSNTHYCGMECWWQAPAGVLQQLVQQFSPDVVLANWALVHRLWHASLDEIDAFLKDVANSLDQLEASKANGAHPRYKFWLPLPFLVSERQPHCVQGRSDHLNAALRGVLQPRGWIEVDWQAMTKKWALDIPDGMHHGPPPTRMLAYLLMHHICHGDGDD